MRLFCICLLLSLFLGLALPKPNNRRRLSFKAGYYNDVKDAKSCKEKYEHGLLKNIPKHFGAVWKIHRDNKNAVKSIYKNGDEVGVCTAFIRRGYKKNTEYIQDWKYLTFRIGRRNVWNMFPDCGADNANPDNCCSSTKGGQCWIGQGTCSSDQDCFGQMKCGSNNCKSAFGWTLAGNCCYDPATLTETGEPHYMLLLGGSKRRGVEAGPDIISLLNESETCLPPSGIKYTPTVSVLDLLDIAFGRPLVEDKCEIRLNKTTMMVIGGYLNGSLLNDVWWVDATLKKTPAPPLTTARAAHCCVTLKDSDDKMKVVVVGGSQNVKYAEIFDLEKETWSQGQLMTDYIAAASCVQYNNSLIIAGGHNWDRDRTSLDTMIKFTLDQGFAPMKQKLNFPRYFSDAFLRTGNLCTVSN